MPDSEGRRSRDLRRGARLPGWAQVVDLLVMKLGWHWILDASGCRSDRIADPGCLREVLETLPAHLGLTAVGPPQSFEHRDASGSTLAGLVLLEESHLSIHAHPALGVLQVDLFSCARFDPERALAFLRERYAFSEIEQRLLERGLQERITG